MLLLPLAKQLLCPHGSGLNGIDLGQFREDRWRLVRARTCHPEQEPTADGRFAFESCVNALKRAADDFYAEATCATPGELPEYAYPASCTRIVTECPEIPIPREASVGEDGSSDER